MKIELGKEKDGWHAKVASHKHLTAFGITRREALEELIAVVEDELDDDKDIRNIQQKINELLKKADA